MNNNKAEVSVIVLPCGKCGAIYTCGECVHMDFERRYGREFYCREREYYRTPDDTVANYCNYFVEKYG